MRALAIATCIALALAARLPADCAPPKLLRMVIQDGSPGVSPTSFAAQPRVVYRLGSKHARIEEQLDATKRLHELIVISEPDSWVVNRVDGTGRHIVDNTAHQAVVIPTLPRGAFPSLPKALDEIEVGCETEFFRAHGSPAASLDTRDGPMLKQAFGVGAWKLVLLSDKVTARPRVLFLFDGNDIRFVLKYLAYEKLSPPDTSLFAKPARIRFSEGRPAN